MLGYVHCPPETHPSGEKLPDDPRQHLPPASPVPGPRGALQTDVGDPLPCAALASPAHATPTVAEPARTRDQTPDPRAGAREGAEERIALTGRLGR